MLSALMSSYYHSYRRFGYNFTTGVVFLQEQGGASASDQELLYQSAHDVSVQWSGLCLKGQDQIDPGIKPTPYQVVKSSYIVFHI